MVRDPRRGRRAYPGHIRPRLRAHRPATRPPAALSWVNRIATSVSLYRLRQRRPPSVAFQHGPRRPPARSRRKPRRGNASRRCWTRSAVRHVGVRRGLSGGPIRRLPDRNPPPRRRGPEQPGNRRALGPLAGDSQDPSAPRPTRLRDALDAACSFEVDERGVLVCDPLPNTPGSLPRSVTRGAGGQISEVSTDGRDESCGRRELRAVAARCISLAPGSSFESRAHDTGGRRWKPRIRQPPPTPHLTTTEALIWRRKYAVALTQPHFSEPLAFAVANEKLDIHYIEDLVAGGVHHPAVEIARP